MRSAIISSTSTAALAMNTTPFATGQLMVRCSSTAGEPTGVIGGPAGQARLAA